MIVPVAKCGNHQQRDAVSGRGGSHVQPAASGQGGHAMRFPRDQVGHDVVRWQVDILRPDAEFPMQDREPVGSTHDEWCRRLPHANSDT